MDPGEIHRLRTALRDLVALSTIPAAWVGREPPAIAAGLADVLVGSLHLDFAFVRLCDPNGGAAVDVTRGDAWKAFPGTRAPLRPWLAGLMSNTSIWGEDMTSAAGMVDAVADHLHSILTRGPRAALLAIAESPRPAASRQAQSPAD